MNHTKALETAIEAAAQAGAKILGIYDTDFESSIENKADNSPLTIADTSANAIICDMLREAFPETPMLTEEADASGLNLDAPYCWVIDPLDGTKEFIKKNGQFTVNIALTHRHRTILGVVYVPVTGVLYYALQGQGAYRREGGEAARRIHVTDKLSKLVWVGSKSHSSKKEQTLIDAHRGLIAETLSAGSSLKGCLVAEGKADVYYRFGYTCEWDTCAMQCVVEESGGVFRQMDGSEMLYLRENHLNEKGFYIVNRKENIWV